MTLQRKTLLIFSLSFLGLLVTLYFTSSFILRANIAGAERDAAKRTLRSSRGLLGQMTDQFSHRFADWAAWSDAVEFVETGNPRFIESNLIDESLSTLHIHSIIFLNKAQRPVFFTGFDTHRRRKTPVPPTLMELLKDQTLTTFKTSGASRDGLFMVEGRVMILTVHPIVPTDLKGPQRGTLVVGRYIDDVEMRRLAELGGTSLSIKPVDGELPVSFQKARTALLKSPQRDAFTLPLSEQELGAYSLLTDIKNRKTLLLQAIVPRDAYAGGLLNLRYLVLALLISAALFGLVTVVSLRRLVLAPLTDLSDEVRLVGEAGDATARVQGSGARELMELSGGINTMLSALEQAQTSLHDSIAALERRSHELALVGEMGGMLQSCRTREEAVNVIVQSLRLLFREENGALCVMNTSQDRVEVVLSWGEDEDGIVVNGEGKSEDYDNGNQASGIGTRPYFAPDECWALRRGSVHIVDDPRQQVLCAHVLPDIQTASLCLPLMAERQTLGVLHLQARKAGVWPAAKLQLARTVVEQISLALFNLELQATLRNQSVRDPLTGLFNRRYMEESLARELSRAERQKHQVAMILFDADHFKRFNDTFGHEAGDLVLKEIAQVLQVKSRKMDIACRYGGEEFLLILPDCPLEIAAQRAEQLREAVKALSLTHEGRRLNQITLSLGVACYPDHETTGDALIRFTDALLYQAKKAGRDRVIVAGNEAALLDAET